MEPVAQYLEQNRDRFVEDLKAALRIPSVSAKPEHQRGRARAARITSPAICKRARHDARRGRLDRRPPGRLRGVAGRPGQADGAASTGTTTCSRSSRSSCGRRRRSSPSCATASCYARGAVDDKGQVYMHLKADRGAHEGERPASDQPEDRDRGRGGGRQREPRGLPARAPPRAGRRRHRRQRHRDARPRPAGAHVRAARHPATRRSRSRGRRTTSTPATSAAR